MGLSTAIAARGFQLFCETMLKHREQAGTQPFDRLAAICNGYLDYASAQPELFLFIFSGQKFNEDDLEFCRHADMAYDILRQACAPLIPAQSNGREVEILVWSLVHGYAHLSMTRKKESPRLDGGWPGLDLLLKHLKKALAPEGNPQS